MNNKIMAALCLVCAIILGCASSAVTGKFFLSFDDSAFGIVLVLIGVSLDFGKYAFPSIAGYQFSKDKIISSIIYSVLALICISISFLASMAYDLNNANRIDQKELQNNPEYIRQNSLFASTQKSIESLVLEIESMKKALPEKENLIRKDFQSRIDSARKLKLITTPDIGVDALSNKRDKAIQQLSLDVKAKEDQLIKNQSEIKTINTEIKIKSTAGVNALATWINPQNPQNAIGLINLIKNIVIEIVGIAFSIGFGVLIGEIKPKKEIITEIKPKIEKEKNIIYKPKPQIGFATSKQINDKDIELVYNHMKQNSKANKKILGYQETASQLNLGTDYVRKIKNHLEHTGKLETKGRGTYLV